MTIFGKSIKKVFRLQRTYLFIDNVVVHNTIDSEHKMEVNIRLNKNLELVVSNPVYPKLSSPATNGTGLKNLGNRFTLLMNKKIRIENDGSTFRVYLPLKSNQNGNIDIEDNPDLSPL